MSETLLTERLFDKVDMTPFCWLWQGATNHDGYGHIFDNGKTKTVSRAVWESIYGAIPDELCVCHYCDVRNCVRPGHLYLATRRRNQQDMSDKGRSTHGEKDGQAKVTTAEVKAMRHLHSEGWAAGQLLQMFGLSRTQINRILNGTRWQHV